MIAQFRSDAIRHFSIPKQREAIEKLNERYVQCYPPFRTSSVTIELPGVGRIPCNTSLLKLINDDRENFYVCPYCENELYETNIGTCPSCGCKRIRKFNGPPDIDEVFKNVIKCMF